MAPDRVCEFVLDPEDQETWGGEDNDACLVRDAVLNENGVWECPHEAVGGGDRCIFHKPADEKDDRAVVEELLAVLETDRSDDDSQVSPQFLGAMFGTFDLSGVVSEMSAENQVVDLSYTTIEGDCDWSDVRAELESLYLDGVEVYGDTTFEHARIEGAVKTRDAEFVGESTFEEARFEDGFDCWQPIFRSETSFHGTQFHGDARFSDGKFGGTLFFNEAEFYGDAQFGKTTFVKKCTFSEATFEGETSFYRATFGVDTDEWEAHDDITFNNAWFRGETNFHNAECLGDASFFEAEFESEVEFDGAIFSGDLEFYGATFNDRVRFCDDLEGANFASADLTEADFKWANCRRANFESALLSRATLFGTDLRGAKLAGAVLGDIRIDDETQFLGHPSDDTTRSPHTVAAMRSDFYCTYDPAYEHMADQTDYDVPDISKAQSVYRALEEVARKASRSRLQARCFVRRQDLTMRSYRESMVNGDSIEERTIAGIRWARTKVTRATILYGESPWRIVASTAFVIALCAMLYPVYGIETGGGILIYSTTNNTLQTLFESLYFSVVTFTTLGYGDVQPVGLARLIATLETIAGSALLAMLVFVFGRRATR